jgi:hypothetical protein
MNRADMLYEVSTHAFTRTQELLRERGVQRREGYVVWVGEMTDRAVVRDVWPVSARGDAAHALVAFDDVVALAERVHSAGWAILAQVHSHPGVAFHSEIDDDHPVSHQLGFISIVVPDFAANSPRVGWAYYEHLGRGRWRELAGDELRRRFVVSEEKEAWWKRLRSVIIGRLSSSAR